MSSSTSLASARRRKGVPLTETPNMVRINTGFRGRGLMQQQAPQQMQQQAQQLQMQFQQSQTQALSAQAQESQARAAKLAAEAAVVPQELEIDKINAITRNLREGDQEDKEF